MDQSNWMKMFVIKIYEKDKNLEVLFFNCGDDEDILCKRWISLLNIAGVMIFIIYI